MKQRLIYFFILIIGLSFIISCSVDNKLRKLQEKYVPESLSNVYIGQKLNDVKEARGIYNLSIIPMKVITIAKEEYTKDSISLIQYQFGKDNKLYEIIIEYIQGFDALKYYKQKFGEMNNGKEWLFTIGKRLKLKVWIYQNRLCIADSKHFSK